VTNILKVLFRLLLVLIFGTLIGVGFYFGIPWLYRATIVPVQQNTEAISDLTQRMTQTETQTGQVVGALQDRTAGMEGEIATLKEVSAVQSAELATAAAQVGELEAQIAQLEAAAEAQADAQAALKRDVDTAARSLSRLASDLRDQQETLTALDEALTPQLGDLTVRAEALALTQGDALARLALIQAAQDLIRVQVLLVEDNVGAARSGLQIAAAHLTRFGTLAPDQAATAAELVARVQALDALIGERSFRTAPLLEALWADIATLALPEVVAPLTELEASGALTSTVGITETVELTATLTVTPTLTPTPRP
jgi:hypothetical protein